MFFSHVAFIYLLVVRTISLSTTLSGLLDILRSVLNIDRESGLSNLIRFDPSSAKGHSDSRMTALSCLVEINALDIAKILTMPGTRKQIWLQTKLCYLKKRTK